MPSKIAVLDITTEWPSMANKKPAIAAKAADLVSNLAIAITKTTLSVPNRAVEKRQLKLFSTPKMLRPSQIIHLPNGGWTT